MLRKLDSSFESSVMMYVGKAMTISPEIGWGWICDSDMGKRKIDDSIVALIPKISVSIDELIYDLNSIRGFACSIQSGGDVLGKKYVFCLALSDGLDFNFTARYCESWRFIFHSNAYFVSSPENFSLHGDAVYGYGEVDCCAPL